MTNYEKIKSMSVEEMDEFIGGIMDCCCLNCEECPLPFPDDESCDVHDIKQWLESEAAQDEQNNGEIGKLVIPYRWCEQIQDRGDEE